MNNLYGPDEDFSRVQATIQARCFHPRGVFVEFKKEEMERSIIERFEEQSVKHRDQIAVKAKHQMFTYDALDQTADRVAALFDLNAARRTNQSRSCWRKRQSIAAI